MPHSYNRFFVCRAALSAVVFFSWIGLSRMLSEMSGMSHEGALFIGLHRVMLLPFMRQGTGLLFCVCLILFVLRQRHLLAGLTAYVILWGMQQTVVSQYVGHDPNRTTFIMPAAVLLTYLLASILEGTDEPAERKVWEACCATIGAVYTLSALNKLNESGIGWINTYSLRVIVTEELTRSSGILYVIRSWLAQSPLVSYCGSAYTLTVELFGVTMLMSRFRPYYAAALLIMHSLIFIGMGIFSFFPWAIFVLVVSFCTSSDPFGERKRRLDHDRP